MSQKESGRKITLSELRKQYPNIPWASFLNLINKVNLQNLDAEEIDILHLLLKDNDKEAQKKAIEEQAVISERLHTLSASMLHRELRIKVPTNVDLDHTQAYLVYGFIIPSSSRTFAGSRSINSDTIRNFVSKKLGYGFNEEKFRVAEKYLLDQGVILTKGGYSLNLRDSGSDITEEGKAIIREAKCFMFNYRSNR